MTRYTRCTAVFLAFVISMGSNPTNAQPLRDRILEDVGIEDRCIVVGFAFPVQYVRHFPEKSGDEIRIRIRPQIIGRTDPEALAGREAVRPPQRIRLHLSEVIFEGDVVGGPYLVIRFDRNVTFRVGVGRDFRSIIILVREEGPDAQCFQK